MRKAVFISVSPYLDDVMTLPVGDLHGALQFYEKVMGFNVRSTRDAPRRSAILVRDSVRIGLEENGGDPTQDGCFIEVDNAEAALAEFESNGLKQRETKFRIDRFGDDSYKVFFVVAPDGLCYCLGEKQNA